MPAGPGADRSAGGGCDPASTPVRPDAAGQLVEAYAEFLLGQRRLAAITAQRRGELAARFLRATARAHGSGWDVGMLQVADLHGFLFDYAPPDAIGHRYQPDDELLAFLEGL